ncbi:MAG: phosphonopyruvate decarboxylase [Vicinamibacteria bacterium]|nr:phosphonopyruvate decarboxylase [Vicinamibacteria bacterium]
MNAAFTPERLLEALRAAGVRELAGVPCSILDPLLRVAEQRAEVRYAACSVEGEAVAFACGAWLAGARAAVLLQNSGLGNTVNPLASLALPYRVPLLIVASWRGEPGREDAVHHAAMGAATLPLLAALEIPHLVLRPGACDLEPAVAALAARAWAERRPVALVVPRGALAGAAAAAPQLGERPAVIAEPPVHFGGGPRPSRREAVAAFATTFAGAAVVSTTGFASRELADAGVRASHFYMQGSMGFALAIGLGVARVRPTRDVAVLDGDGALLMRLGSLATVGALAPPRLAHVVLDNGAYASTGGQRTVAASVDFAAAALACGYGAAADCDGSAGLAAALAWSRERMGRGPSLLRLRITAAEGPVRGRPEVAPEVIADAFRGFLAAG